MHVSVVGLGSSVFHPTASRVAQMASGGKKSLAQSIFQVGGNGGAKLHICCGIKEEKPNYFAHDFAQSQKIRADLQALPYKNVIIYHFLAE